MFLKYIAFLATLCLLITRKSALPFKVSCDYIENVIGGKEDEDRVLERPENTNGCVTKDDGNEYITTNLLMINSTIKVLKKNAVRNMPWLEIFTCLNCTIYEMEPGTFQNVSNLKILEFIHGPMTMIRRGVFVGFPKLEVLDIRGNEIFNIDDQAFANLPALEYINLNENQMEYWKAEWFSNTPSLETINFIKNQLRSIPPFAFTKFERIRNLNFDDNRISVIRKDAFLGVKYLITLGLANNLLTTLSATIFPEQININTLDISGNELNYLSSGTLGILTVHKIYLEGNPWQCQCLNLINFWLKLTGGQLKSNSDDSVCNGPNIPVCVSSSASTCLESVDRDLTRRYNTHPEVIKRKANELCTKSYHAANRFREKKIISMVF